jgi:O-acetyl-ADP-ribose deacetylase (regulator of RNase III)
VQVHVAQADISALPVDAIVNPANSMGIMGGGVSGHIRRVGGDSIQAEAMKKAPIAVGAALVTHGGQLPAKHVIHVPTMEEPGMKIGVENIRRAARAALIAANANKFAAVGFPGMGTDQGGVAFDEAARAIVEEIRAHRKSFPEVIWLVDEADEMVAAFQDALQNASLGL